MATESFADSMAAFVVDQFRQAKEEIESYKKEPSEEIFGSLATRVKKLQQLGSFLCNNDSFKLLFVASPALMDLGDKLQMDVSQWVTNPEDVPPFVAQENLVYQFE